MSVWAVQVSPFPSSCGRKMTGECEGKSAAAAGLPVGRDGPRPGHQELGDRPFHVLSVLRRVIRVKNGSVAEGRPRPRDTRFSCSQVQPSAQVPEVNRAADTAGHGSAGRAAAPCGHSHRPRSRGASSTQGSPVSCPLARHVQGLLVERAHRALSSHRYSCLQVSAVSGPNIRLLRALWSEPEPFIQFLALLLGLSAFGIPTCWPVRLESCW